MDEKYQEALNRIQEAKKTNSTKLNLSTFDLTQFPPEILELTKLIDLNLTGNKLVQRKRSYLEILTIATK